MHLCSLCLLHCWTRNIPSRLFAAVSFFLSILGAFIDVFKGAEFCLYILRRHSRGRSLFPVWDVFYLSKRHPHFPACSPAFQETQVMIKIELNADFPKTFFPLGKGMKTSGGLQVAVTSSQHKINHTQRRNSELGIWGSVVSPVLCSHGLFF